MNRLVAVLVLLAALGIGWVPVFAAPARLAAEMNMHDTAAGTSPAPIHVHHASGCAGKQQHCPQDAKQQHPAVCAACIGVPAVAPLILLSGQARMIIPRGKELPLVARSNAPLPRPPSL
ncbi:MAG: hypothetical protein AAAC48_10080 [Phyllobacterium sp.]|jgi:hypothetical protein|uniref:hypothetical protein n=1 Tax=Phyllobacterium sp. TaxID=1871046 RepID=UPI0030F3579C